MNTETHQKVTAAIVTVTIRIGRAHDRANGVAHCVVNHQTVSRCFHKREALYLFVDLLCSGAVNVWEKALQYR